MERGRERKRNGEDPETDGGREKEGGNGMTYKVGIGKGKGKEGRLGKGKRTGWREGEGRRGNYSFAYATDDSNTDPHIGEW